MPGVIIFLYLKRARIKEYPFREKLIALSHYLLQPGRILDPAGSFK